MMTTCILFAGCLEGLTGEVEEVVESLTPECNDPSALNYDENGTNADVCISEEILLNSINEGMEAMDSEVAAGGFVMTMSGDMSDLDEGLGMDGMDGQFTMISTTASNGNAMYSSTEVKMNGMTVLSQSWMADGTPYLDYGNGMTLQAGTTDGEFLMYSAMSWEDFLADADGQMSDDSDEGPDAAWYFLNIDTDSNNLVSWDEVDDFVIGADGGWESDEDRDEVNQDFNNSDSNADGFLDENEFEFFFAEEDDGDDMDDSDDMDDGMDMDLDVDGMMDDMFSMFDGIDEDCDGYPDEDCGFPEGSTVELSDGMDGFTFSTPVEEGQTMDMTFDCDFYTIDVNGCTMTGFSMDMEDGSEMVLEILSVEEVAALLTIDTTLGYEALPFIVEVVPMFICDNGEEIPAEWENDGEEDCEDGSDEPADVFVCDNGEEIPASWENDGEEDCDDGSDEEPWVHSWESYENGYCEWEGNADGDETVWWCKYSQDDEDWDTWWYYCENHDVDWHCTDDKGQSADYENSANGTEWGEEEVFVCDNGEEIPVSYVNNDWDDCGDGSDEWDAPDLTWIVYSEAEFAFEGALDDYNIVISSCTEANDDMGETTLTCGEDLMSVNLVDAVTNLDNAPEDLVLGNYSGIIFADIDESGTLSDGDYIGIGGDTGLDWNHVRLHSTSADAYSDENPLHQLPGFTAVLGVLSLMGAAMMGRRD